MRYFSDMQCPRCRAPEVPRVGPRTVYACGSSDYDQRAGTLEIKCNTADAIRAATARNELHALVRGNYASPRGLCNANTTDGGIFFCTLDYGHAGQHVNGPVEWELQWPPA